jgi:tetratricopeptide (TPR) repeat protein
MEKLPPAIESEIERAISFKNKGDNCTAIEILEQVDRDHPDIVAAVGLLGCLLWSEKELDRAVPVLQRSVELSPRAPMISLALFHSLWELDRKEDALEEMKRHLSATGQLLPDYQAILEEMNKKWGETSL